MNYADVLGILSFFGTFWLAMTIIAVMVVSTRFFQKRRMNQLGFELAMTALERQMSAEEVERILLAFSNDARLAKSVLDSVTQKAVPTPHAKAYMLNTRAVG